MQLCVLWLVIVRGAVCYSFVLCDVIVRDVCCSCSWCGLLLLVLWIVIPCGVFVLDRAVFVIVCVVCCYYSLCVL